MERLIKISPTEEITDKGSIQELMQDKLIPNLFQLTPEIILIGIFHMI